MGSIVDALPILVDRLELISGVTTVLPTVPEQDPSADELPLIALKVNAPSSTGVMDRRTLLWSVDLYLFGRIRSENIAADIAAVLPFYEAIIGQLDGDLTLGNTLDGVITYPDPIGTEPGVIAWRKQTFVGFIVRPILPILSETAYS